MAKTTWDGACYDFYAPPIFASPPPLPALPQDRSWWMTQPIVPAAGGSAPDRPGASHLLPAGHPWGNAPLIFPPAPADAAGQRAPAQPLFTAPQPPPLADTVNALSATPDHRAPDPVSSDDPYKKLGDPSAPAGMTDIGPPLIGDGGQLFPGTAWGRKAADIGSELAYRYLHGLLTLPQRAIKAAQQSAGHDFGPGPATISDSDPPWQDPLIPVAVETALTATGGAGVVPARANTLRAGLTGARRGAGANIGPAPKAEAPAADAARELNTALKAEADARRAAGVRAAQAGKLTANGFVRDFPIRLDGYTKPLFAWYKSEGEARALARQKLGRNPVKVEDYKWRSDDGRWQYRANLKDLQENHVHLEELDPTTGEVLQNWHLQWPEGTER